MADVTVAGMASKRWSFCAFGSDGRRLGSSPQVLRRGGMFRCLWHLTATKLMLAEVWRTSVKWCNPLMKRKWVIGVIVF